MKIVKILLVVFTISTLFVTSTFAEGFQYRTYSKGDKHPLNTKISKLYNTEVYGDPHGDFMEYTQVNQNGQSGEYKYLGYNYDNNEITNDRYFPDIDKAGKIFDQNYTGVTWHELSNAEKSWKLIREDAELLNYMTTTNFCDADHITAGKTDTGMNIIDLLGADYQKKALVTTIPTKGSTATIYLEYSKNGGTRNYNTILIHPIPYVECVMSGTPDRDSIPNGQKQDVNIIIDTSDSFWTSAGLNHNNFAKREYWAGIGSVAESQKVESIDGTYTFKVKNVSPNTTITVWSKVYSGELESLGFQSEDDAIEYILIGESSAPGLDKYDLDYNILSRMVKYPLSDTSIIASLSKPKGSWNGNASGSLQVKNKSIDLLRGFSVENNPGVNESASTIVRNPEIHTTLNRIDFGDDPQHSGGLNLSNPVQPITKDGTVSFEGSVSRPYKYSYYCSGCKVDEEGESYCSGHTGHATATAEFNSGSDKKAISAFIYNGKSTITPKSFNNTINNNYTNYLRKELFWTSELYKLNVIRWMYHMNEYNSLYNSTAVNGQYKRNFTQQCNASVTWSAAETMEQNYKRSREAARDRDYRKSEYDRAVFASDIDFKNVDYPIKSGYYFNPTGEYTFTVETVTYKTTNADTNDHKELVDSTINAFRYQSDLMYINNDKNPVNLQNELLSEKGSSYERRPAALTAQDPTGVDDAVLLNVLDRSDSESRYSKTVKELNHTQSISGDTHEYLKEILEGYNESGTIASKNNFKYREYIKDGQHIYKITEKTTITIQINPTNRKVYTHVHMPDGKYAVKVWIGDIELSNSSSEYKKLGTLKGISSLDEIEISVKGSLFEDTH